MAHRAIGGIGIDVAPFARMARWIADHEARLSRVFTMGERAFCDAASGDRRVARYAAAFAAKEAVMKALGTGWRSDVEWREIDTRTCDTAGAIRLTGNAALVAEAQSIARILVSTGAAAGAAFAAAVAERHA
ncbi:MAG TPA: 4'-phosphopantetheinyl transferase superfamily protein [Vicinamibacterales bacterium]|nr:4'-phosphopantetheinyl transferase superfamily protein [Vicinamibacterales bacterium]